MARMSWEANARCNAYDPDIFFDPRVRFERKAKTICGRCQVRTECLSYALQARVEFGVWGGLNWKERRTLLKGSARIDDWNELVQRATVGV
jgi:WhiB family redox-sensing transcriptional regulator